MGISRAFYLRERGTLDYSFEAIEVKNTPRIPSTVPFGLQSLRYVGDLTRRVFFGH